MPLVYGLILTFDLGDFSFFCFFKNFSLGLTFRVRLGLGLALVRALV